MKNIGDMMGLMKQAQKMKKEMSRIKKEISKSIIIASDSNQIITISVNGDYQVKKVTVNDDALKNMSTKQIENVVEEAFSNTIKQVKDMTNEKMKNLSDMGVPKDFNLPMGIPLLKIAPVPDV